MIDKHALTRITKHVIFSHQKSITNGHKLEGEKNQDATSRAFLVKKFDER